MHQIVDNLHTIKKNILTHQEESDDVNQNKGVVNTNILSQYDDQLRPILDKMKKILTFSAIEQLSDELHSSQLAPLGSKFHHDAIAILLNV